MAYECVAVAASARKLCSVDGCGRQFSAKGFCNRHYQRHIAGRPLRNKRVDREPWQKCGTIGCEATVRSAFSAFCEKHYGRVRRRGSDSDPVLKGRWMSTDGYVLTGPHRGHPVANKEGVAYEHRKVLYDAIGPGEHPCNWCRSPVRWDVRRGAGKLVVDHVNGDKQENDLQNLVPSCHPCNANRGLFMSWVIRHADDPFLAQLFAETRFRGPEPRGGCHRR